MESNKIAGKASRTIGLLCQLSLSLEILEPELQETVHSDPGMEKEGNGASV